jgi:RNA polymerase sigma-70 factor, ECF subfamily
MSAPANLGPAFLDGLAPALRPAFAAAAELAGLLDQILQQARASYPALALPPELFLRYLAERVPPGGDPIAALRRLKSADLYLACACVQQLPGALETLEQQHFPTVRAAVARLTGSESALDDLTQHLLERLMARRPGTIRRLERYAGRGDLAGWLCVTAVREARALKQRRERERPADDALLEGLVSPGADQEIAYLKQLYRREFQEAFAQALAQIGAADRNLLRYQLLHDLSIDEIGRIFKVHRATAARRLERLRARLVLATRQALMERIRIDPAQLESIMRLIGSEMHVSIQRLLKDEEPNPKEVP